jgi:hypothetical protein
MSLSNQTAETLAATLGGSLKDLRDDLRVVLQLVQQLEQHAAYTTALAQGQPVRIKPQKSPPTDGPPRGRGRPPGAQNHLTVFASPAEIARLRAELAALPT